MGTINKTLLEVTTRIFNSVYRKTFEVKEHVWSEDQGICIDLCSIYTNLEDWSEFIDKHGKHGWSIACLLYTSPSPRDVEESRMPSSA